jgi:hypothetical protein
MAYHWKKEHSEAEYPRGYPWPRLRRITYDGTVTLDETIPPSSNADTDHSSSLAASPNQVAEEPERTHADNFLPETQFHEQSSVDQYPSPPTPGYNPNLFPHAVHGLPPSPSTSLNTDSTNIGQYQYNPVYGNPFVTGQSQGYLNQATPTSSNDYSPPYQTTPAYSASYSGAPSVVGGHYVPPFNHELKHRRWDHSVRGNSPDQDPSGGGFYRGF